MIFVGGFGCGRFPLLLEICLEVEETNNCRTTGKTCVLRDPNMRRCRLK
jgi:hypothetical protein